MSRAGMALWLGLSACNQLESEEVAEGAKEVAEEVAEEAKEVADVTRKTVVRGVDKAKEALDRVDMEKVRRTWDAAVGAISGSDGSPTPSGDPLAGAAEAITCDADERCTVTAEFIARARRHSTRVAGQVRVTPIRGEVRGIRIDAIDSGSVAQHVGLRTGDVVTHVNQVPLGTIQDAMLLYVRIRSATSFTVHYRRGGQERVLTVDVV